MVSMNVLSSWPTRVSPCGECDIDPKEQASLQVLLQAASRTVIYEAERTVWGRTLSRPLCWPTS